MDDITTTVTKECPAPVHENKARKKKGQTVSSVPTLKLPKLNPRGSNEYFRTLVGNVKFGKKQHSRESSEAILSLILLGQTADTKGWKHCTHLYRTQYFG